MRPVPVDSSLRDRVAAIEVVDHEGGEVTILPTPSAVLGIQIRGCLLSEQRILSPGGVTGIQHRARTYRYQGRTVSLLVRFTPQGSRCLGLPASEFAAQQLTLGEVLPAGQARDLSERVVNAESVEDSITALEDFLLALPYQRDALVDRALTLLNAGADGSARVAQVARSLGMSERQFERRFREQVGIAPKRYASLVRFERAIALARRSQNLADAAVAAGYYDQSHFVRAAGRYAGITPSKVVALIGSEMSDSYNRQ